jgi:transposase
MERVAELERENEKLALKATALERENKILREEVASLRQARFGRSSERIASDQLALFLNGEFQAAPVPESVASSAEPPAAAKKQNAHGRSVFASNLPRQVVESDLPDGERVCQCCGKTLVLIGEDVSERGHVIPAQFVVRRYVRKKYACPDGHTVKTAPMPEGVIAGAKYEGSVHAYLATAKYSDHLPLHRLEGIFKRQGLHLPKQTMWDMLVRLDELVAQPVLRQMRDELLEEPVLHADETPVTLCLEDGKGSRKGYVFGWRSLAERETPKILIEFRASRGRDGPTKFLGKWSGTAIFDGYSGYDEVVARNGIVRAGCWSHARRKLKEALDVGSREAALLLVHVNRLFALERAINGRAERRKFDQQAREALRSRVRAKRSRKLVDKIQATTAELVRRRGTLPKSKLGKALGYLQRQGGPLGVFLSDPRIPIHNNDSERDLRHIAMGRNNWVVFASLRGGELACRMYSLVLSCREAGVDPQAYLEDVLEKVSTTRASEIASLTPWAWAEAREREASELA